MKHSMRLASVMMICATAMPVAALAFPIVAPGTEGFRVIVAGTGAIVATYQGNSADHSDDLYLMLDASGNPGDDGNPAKVSVFDIAGRRLATVENGSLAAGVYQRAWVQVKASCLALKRASRKLSRQGRSVRRWSAG